MSTRNDSKRSTFLCALLLSACVDDRVKPKDEGKPVAVAAWDFPAEPGAALVALWPPSADAPKRLKRGMTTKEDQGALAVVVSGADPAFSWDFAAPVAVSTVQIRVTAERPGMLQLFFTSLECPTYSEPCSSKADLDAGENVVTFFLDALRPVRTLRLDPPDHAGDALSFHTVDVHADERVASPWKARDTIARLETTSLGLSLESAGTDPGLTTTTPGLTAESATAFEVIERGPPNGVAQLFWTGPCPFFSEACSVAVRPADSGALTHRAVLRGHPRWKGPITALRFDPGRTAGTYVLERLALVHAPSD